MKLEYDQCFYKYIEQKTKELFMSVNSVNGISQMQNAQGVSFGSSNQDEGSGLDIGKLLVGGVVVAAVAGVGIAGYKSGKTLKEGDGVLTTVWNGIKSWFGKNGDDVAQVAKKYVDLDDVGSLTDSKKIAKAQEVLDATKNNLTVSNNKALKHMENIEDITNSLFKKGKDGKSTKDVIEKIDDTLFAKINGTKGLEGTFELAQDGKSLIIKDADKFNAYFGKRINGWSTYNNNTIELNSLPKLFQDTSEYYTKKQTIIANKLNLVNSNSVLCLEEANKILNMSPEIKATINKEADFKQMAELEYYKEHQDLLIARARKAGFGEDEIKKLFPSGGGGEASSTSPSVQTSSSSIFPSLESLQPTSRDVTDETLDAMLAGL